MHFISLTYLVFLFISATIYWFFPVKHRKLFLIFISLLFICSYKWVIAFLFLFMGTATYFSSRFILSTTSNWKKKIIFISILIGFIVSLFLYKYFGLNLLLVHSSFESFDFLIALGFSYVSFRMIHYIIESYRKNVPDVSFLDFICYVVFFPIFLAGPIERFQAFHRQTAENKHIGFYDVNYGLYRIICGVFKKVAVADVISKLITPVLYYPLGHSKTILILSVYGLAIQIYMDFSGYTDIAIGSARLFGYRLTENFNRPFLQKNIALFWRNWHISLYTWIRDYFFFPLFGYRASKVKIYIGIFFSMMVFILWHRLSLSFFILGLYHGTGLICWHIFQGVKRKYPIIRRGISKRYLDPISIFFTFSFHAFGTLFFIMNFEQVLIIVKSIINLK